MSIPSKIHLVFLRKDETFPALFGACEARIRAMHPSWEVKLWHGDSADRFLKTFLSDYLDAYRSFSFNVQRADFLRLALVYVLGGFYMDLDMLAIQPLDNLTGRHIVLAEEKTIGEEEQRALGLRYRTRIANYMFGSEPGHPFLRMVMDGMAKRSHVQVASQQEILDITGPGLLTDLYWDHASQYADITLLRNGGRYYTMADGHRESCLFGDYAVHLHSGTWRKEI